MLFYIISFFLFFLISTQKVNNFPVSKQLRMPDKVYMYYLYLFLYIYVKIKNANPQ